MRLKNRKQPKNLEKNGKISEAVHAEYKRLDCETVSDSELVRRFKMGDEKAFSFIVLKYQKRLINTARVILGDEDEAMDISQEAFIKAYFNLKKFRNSSSLYTWLYRIIYNLCISTMRRRKIIKFLSIDDHGDSTEIYSKQPNPEKEYEHGEFRAALSEALSKLPIRQRTVFIMKQIDCLKHSEIAHVLGITEGSVKASYFHAVNKLKSMLQSYGEEYEMR